MCLLGWGGSQGGRGGRGRQAVYGVPMTAFLGKGGWRAADGAGPGVPSAELSLGTGGHICPDDGRLALGSGVWKVRLSPRSSGRIAKNFKCLLLRQSHQGPKTGLQEFRGSERGAGARPGRSRQPVDLSPSPTFRPWGPSSRASEGPAAFIPRREAGWPSGRGTACSARVPAEKVSVRPLLIADVRPAGLHVPPKLTHAPPPVLGPGQVFSHDIMRVCLGHATG